MGVRDRSLRFLPMSARNGIFRAEAPPLARLAECLPAHARGRTLSPSPSVPRRPPPGLSRPVERGRAIPLTRPGRAALRTRGRLTTGGGVSRARSRPLAAGGRPSCRLRSGAGRGQEVWGPPKERTGGRGGLCLVPGCGSPVIWVTFPSGLRNGVRSERELELPCPCLPPTLFSAYKWATNLNFTVLVGGWVNVFKIDGL